MPEHTQEHLQPEAARRLRFRETSAKGVLTEAVEGRRDAPRSAPGASSLTACLLACAVLMSGTPARADETETGPDHDDAWSIAAWSVQTSVHTVHFHPDPDHVNNQHMLDVEAHFNNRWLAGGAVFDNSFGQPSQLLYIGRTWPLFDSPHWYVKLIGGLLHGYEEPHEDKIPLNNLGIAPAIVPSLGFRYRHVLAEAHLGGLAVLNFSVGLRF